ncbi:MAG: hypothetical protein ABSH28_14795 [Acidobacteriota bacterium]
MGCRFIRLYTEGAHLVDQDQAFDLFPTIGMPGEKKDAGLSCDKDEGNSQ